MNCNKTDCIHYKVCQEWKSLDNDNYINDSYGDCENYNPTVKPQKIVTIPHELIEKLVLCVVDTVENIDWDKAIEAYKERPQGEFVDISKLRLMTLEECASHTANFAMGWKACIEWIKRGCDKE